MEQTQKAGIGATPNTFSADRAIWNQRQVIQASAKRLHDLIAAVDFTLNLSQCQWGQWFASAMEFRPDLIIELGRGKGNSTALFTEAANQLGNCEVLSFCLCQDWGLTTAARIKPLVPEGWFKPLDARVGNFLTTGIADDLGEIISRHERILILWDAHGFAVSQFVLGCLLPQVESHPHLVLMHDLSDARYTPSLLSYKGKDIWNGGDDFELRDTAPVILGNVCSDQEQAVAIVDFTSRNGIELRSADHDLYTGLSASERGTLENDLGDLWSFPGHWYWFTTNGATTPITYPKWGPDFIVEKIKALETRIREMEASPFWKARQLVAGLLRRPS